MPSRFASGLRILTQITALFRLIDAMYILQQEFTGSGTGTTSFGGMTAMAPNMGVIGSFLSSSGGDIHFIRRVNNTWTRQEIMRASEPATNYYGHDMSINEAGSIVAISAHGVNSVYVLEGYGPGYKITGSSGTSFGVGLSVSKNTIAIGAHLESSGIGAAYVHIKNGSSWSLQQKLTPFDGASGDYFGYDVSLQGDTLVVGSIYDDDKGTSSGSVYIYKRSGTTWFIQQKLVASDGAANDQFGYVVMIKGKYIFVAAPWDNSNGAIYVFYEYPYGFKEIQKIAPSSANGRLGYWKAVDADSSATTLVFGSANSLTKKVFVYKRNGTTFLLDQEIVGPSSANNNPLSVAMSCDSLLIGDYSTEKVFVYSNGLCQC